MLVASLTVDRSLCKWLRVNIKFAQAVDYDVGVNVACEVFTIGVSTDQSLMPRKIDLCIFHADGLRPLTCQVVVNVVFRIVADDVMVTFNFIVNAMLIHDFSDNTIRKLKTDRADALKIANYALTFWDTLPPFNNEEETRLLLKMQSRANERITATATALRNGLIALADQTFPGVNIAFDPNTKNANGHEKWVDFFLRYWHKDCVCQYSMEAFTESYRGWCKRKNYKFRTDTAHKIYLLAQEGVATLPKCESTKMLITQACKSLNAVCEAKQSTQLEMQRLTVMLPEYEVVMQMEGAGPITGPALMAEIGDVRRFKNKKALVAFAGIDAPPFQSGAFESKSRHVSKRGSPHLRRTIFIVSNIILTRSNPENAVYCFMDKKRSERKHYYVYTVAGSAKFLRVYYARVTEFLRSQPSPDAC